jgi:hypothetical protein
METLLNTDFFIIIKKYSYEGNSENILLAYNKFVRTLTALFQNAKDSKYLYFLFSFTKIELLAIQEVDNNENPEKKVRL